MAEKSFGRRQAQPRSSAASPATSRTGQGDAPATSDGAPARRSVAVLAGIACVVTVAAAGLAFALSSADEPQGADESSVTSPSAERTECRAGQDDCTNAYEVKLACTGQDE